jgi:Protein of unknown function (DUF3891)
VLLRNDQKGVLAIGQPAHAWVSGQLARGWGNAEFGAVAPREEVCLGAEQHDVGMAAWDLAPTRNPETGLPHSFMELPLSTHLELWRAGPPRLLTQSRYAALLVSMHGHRLYQHRDLGRLTPAEGAAVQAFLRDQHGWQQLLLQSLRADPATARAATPELVRRNSDLLWTWDFLSLALCLRWPPCTAREVPAAQGTVDLLLEPGDSPLSVTIDPWPFTSADGLSVRCEGRRIGHRSDLGEAVGGGRWETLDFQLVPRVARR